MTPRWTYQGGNPDRHRTQLGAEGDGGLPLWVQHPSQLCQVGSFVFKNDLIWHSAGWPLPCPPSLSTCSSAGFGSRSSSLAFPARGGWTSWTQMMVLISSCDQDKRIRISLTAYSLLEIRSSSETRRQSGKFCRRRKRSLVPSLSIRSQSLFFSSFSSFFGSSGV